MKKILLHCCCGVCAFYPTFKLKEIGFEPILYFYNPNISNEIEYDKRLNGLKILAKKASCELIEDRCDFSLYEKSVTGYENEPEKGKRCEICFDLRLKKTYNKSKELKIEQFTTSLSISPHKNSKMLFETAKKYKNFLAIDFKKQDGFKKTMNLAKENELYIQNYCGCKYSKRG